MQFIRPLLFRATFWLCMSLLTQQTWCQTFGGLPPSIEWMQINTDTVRIIFPSQLEPQAQRLANAIHYLHQHAQEDIGDKTYKIDIVVNNQSTIANGSVSIAPWRSHFLTTPLQDNFALTSMPWLDLLAIHEYRHVTQLSTARRGIVKLLSYLFGQESWAGGANLSIPNWFTEGDAVWAETEFSNQGRGRVAHFLQGYRAFDNEGKRYSYAKARNGSIKDYVPDHYRLGYLLLRHGHEQYGETFWKRVLMESSAYKGILYPFSNAIKRKTGLNTRELYHQMLDEVDLSLNLLPESRGTDEILPTANPTIFTDYLHPYFYAIDSSLIYFKRTYEKIGAFYAFNLASGREERLLTRGIGIEPYFGHANGLLAWTELTTDSRWHERDYTDIITYDIRKNVRKRITRKMRYFSPQPDSAGVRIICTNVNEIGESSLHLLNAQTGEILKIFQHPGWFYTFPKWSHDSQAVIAAVRDQNGHMGLVSIDIETGAERELFPMRNKILGIPAVNAKEVFYSASTETLENIFATDLITGSTRQITEEANGAFQAALSPDGLYYTTFTSNGHVIRKTAEIGRTNSGQVQGDYEFNVERNMLDSFPKLNYSVKDYKQWRHSFNVHTWGLNIDDPEISARILSNNVLNNVELSAGVTYDYDRQIYRPFAELQIATFYPTIALQASTIKRSAIIEDRPQNWREVNLFAGALVDFNLMSRSFQRTLTPLLGYNRTGLTGDIDTSI
ncbi:MAG: hypothetical protein HKN76_21880, partial [Saprospiraceae bacterium]|nr:hypothetical protein [Saprospiraceae bacterium]